MTGDTTMANTAQEMGKQKKNNSSFWPLAVRPLWIFYNQCSFVKSESVNGRDSFRHFESLKQRKLSDWVSADISKAEQSESK